MEVLQLHLALRGLLRPLKRVNRFGFVAGAACASSRAGRAFRLASYPECNEISHVLLHELITFELTPHQTTT